MMMVPWRVAAQTTTKTYHLASLTASSPFLTNSPNIAMFLPALAEHGYMLGQNLEYTPYGADMHLDQLPQIARDIAANKIDAVIAFCEEIGVQVANPHSYVVKEGGMVKDIGSIVDFKRRTDPFGLLNPGKLDGTFYPGAIKR